MASAARPGILGAGFFVGAHLAAQRRLSTDQQGVDRYA
jgi:hypothetical protein